jgi:N-acetylglucosamine repressor
MVGGRKDMKYVHSTTDRDRKVIEAVVRKFGPLSQVQINELMDIRPTTVSLLVRDLLDAGKILEVGRSNNPVGRKQVLLRPNPEWAFAVAVALDEEEIDAVVMDLHASPRQAITERIQPVATRANLIQALIRCVKHAIAEADLTSESLLGIGISDPGLVDTRAGVSVMSSTIPFWKEVPLKSIFEKEFGVPAFLQTSTRAKTLAERLLGTGKMSDNMIYLDYGAGIGAGIVVDGKLLYGTRGAAGEFGHTHVIEGGPVCSCGSFGCLEAIAGTRALASKVRKAASEGVTTSAMELVDGNLASLTGWAVLEAANKGDKLCSHVVAETASYLGVALSNLINLFDPSAIVLDRRLEVAGPGFLNSVVQTMRRQSLACPEEQLEICYGKFHKEGSLLGAGLLVIEDYFEIPILKPPRFLKDPDWSLPARSSLNGIELDWFAGAG